MPVVRADVLEAHGGGLPLIGRAHVDGRIAPVGLDLVDDLVELRHGLGRGQAQLLEDLLVVDEAMDDRGHGHAEGRLAVVGLPGALGDGGEILDPLDVVDGDEIALLVEIEGGVEGPAGDEIAGGAARQPRIEGGVVFRRRRRLELDLDVRIFGVEGRDDGAGPDIGIVIAPALDGEGLGGARRMEARRLGGDHQCRCCQQAPQHAAEIRSRALGHGSTPCLGS